MCGAASLSAARDEFSVRQDHPPLIQQRNSGERPCRASSLDAVHTLPKIEPAANFDEIIEPVLGGSAETARCWPSEEGSPRSPAPRCPFAWSARWRAASRHRQCHPQYSVPPHLSDHGQYQRRPPIHSLSR